MPLLAKAKRQALRQTHRAKRRALSHAAQQQASTKVLEKFKRILTLKKPSQIALYLPFDGELETASLIAHCWQADIPVFLPTLVPIKKGELLFFLYTPSTPMRLNQFSIKEPDFTQQSPCDLSQLDIIFMPLVAFDSQGQRLGMGGGFYDRTLAQTDLTQKSPLRIGLAHDCQYVEYLPIEPWDLPLAWVLTPTRAYQFQV